MRQRGFALLIVIWMIALIGVLAGGMAAETTSQARIIRNRLSLVHARAIAEAGVTLAVAGLLEPDPAQQWPADGRTKSVHYDNGDVAIAIQDEDGKIDVNMAPVELLAGLFTELGVADATALAQAVADRRLAAAPPQPTPQAATAGLGILAGRRAPQAASSGDLRTLPFAALAELRRLPGMTRPDFARVEPYLTVYSQSARINPRTAPREVLLALPGVSPQEVGFTLAARATQEGSAANSDPPILSGVDRYVEIADVRAATVTATATTADGGRFVRQAVVLLTGAPDRPYHLALWRRGADRPVETPAP